MRTELPGSPAAEHRQLSHRLRGRLAALRAEHPLPPPPGLRANLRRLVIVASSSRGGSSVFAEFLRHEAGLLHLRGEINPYLRLHDLAFPTSGSGSDALGPAALTDAELAARVDEELSRDCGRPSVLLDTPQRRDRFALDLAERLTLQWPRLTFTWSGVRGWLDETLGELVRQHHWPPGRFVDAQLFHAVFLSRVRGSLPEVNPHYYDLEPRLVRACCPDACVEPGPPGPQIVEEPPFVTITPWEPTTGDDLHERPLLVKTPSNVYRLDALRGLFPAARFSVLHLTRNGYSATNGLCDGWCYHGFFAHCLPQDLEISGYSDRFPEWGGRWWKFDLPPEWCRFRTASLGEVCAFQWHSAHRAVLDFLARNQDVPAHRVHFEEIVASTARRRAAFNGLLGWLDVPLGRRLAEVIERGLPPIMATDRPRHHRWYRRAAILERLLDRPHFHDLMRELGYERDPATWL